MLAETATAIGPENLPPVDAANNTPTPDPPTVNTANNTPTAKPAGWTFAPVTAAAFDSEDCRPTWLVRQLLVKDQPMLMGGPKKTLKTTLLLDRAVSVASGTPFLGKFDAEAKRRVAFLSGESGKATIQETARRICAARGVNLADLDILFQFDLPQLGRRADVKALGAGIAAAGAKVVMIDPLYLCLLAGGANFDAANMFDMGPLFADVAAACLDAGLRRFSPTTP